MEDARNLGKGNWRNVARNRELVEASKKGLGSKRAVVPVMMMMMMMTHYITFFVGRGHLRF